jgi:hypothetical protein
VNFWWTASLIAQVSWSKIRPPADVINEHFSEKLRECSRARKVFGGNNEYRLAAIRLQL